MSAGESPREQSLSVLPGACQRANCLMSPSAHMPFCLSASFAALVSGALAGSPAVAAVCWGQADILAKFPI